MSLSDDFPTRPLDMEGEGIPAAHIAGINMDHRAPDLTVDQQACLPSPILDGAPELLALYWRCWAIAFDKVHPGTPEKAVVAHVDAAFSDNLFQWDSCYLIEFLKFAPNCLPVYGTLDNFYGKQHENGFICREINGVTGEDFWEEDHPSAINPPLFADAEWRLYQHTADTDRLRTVLPTLVRYFDWLKTHRQAKDGIGYFTTALASGMDNTPRPYEYGGGHVHKDYGYVWLCITAQQALAASCIAQIAQAVDDSETHARFAQEAQVLRDYINRHMWHNELGLYVDRGPQGQLTSAKTPATCWPLLLSDVPAGRAHAVARVLTNPRLFFRTHAVPSLSVDHPVYHPRGNYWHGAVWPPMVHLVVRALRENGCWHEARAIAANHLANVEAVLRATGTIWENYAAETVAPGNIARPEFAGWTACGPITDLIETMIGVSVEAPAHRINWWLDRPDRHGVSNLGVGADRISLVYDPVDRVIESETTAALMLVVSHVGRQVAIRLEPGRALYRLDDLNWQTPS